MLLELNGNLGWQNVDRMRDQLLERRCNNENDTLKFAEIDGGMYKHYIKRKYWKWRGIYESIILLVYQLMGESIQNIGCISPNRFH